MKPNRRSLAVEILEDRCVPAAGFVAVGADGGAAKVRIFADRDNNDTYETRVVEFTPFGAAKNGARVALGDFDGDGNDELVVAQGPGAQPRVLIYDLNSDGTPGGLFDSFLAFAASFRGGVNVATGDLDGDGRDELVVSTDSKGAQIKVFSDIDFDGRVSDNLVDQLSPFGGFKGGVRVALGNTNNIGGEEIVVGRGPGGRPDVRVYTDSDADRAVSDQPLLESFRAYAASFKGGVYVAAGQIENVGGLGAEIIVGPGKGLKPQVRVFSDLDNDGLTGDALFTKFNAYANSFKGGVRVAASDTDDSGTFVEIITVPAAGTQARVRIFDDNGDPGSLFTDNPPSNDFSGLPGTQGAFVAAGKVRTETFAFPSQPQSIPENATLLSSFTVAGTAGIIRDLDISINLFHTFNGDLDVTLTHVPSGLSLVLFTDIGDTDEGLIIRLNDEAGTDIATANSPTNGAVSGQFNPQGAGLLALFNGLDASGEWRLTVTDDTAAGADIGTLFGWALHVTY